MALDLTSLCVDANDPPALANFWGTLLGWDVGPDATTLLPTDDTGFSLSFLQKHRTKTAQNLAHFDLTSSSLDDQAATVARAVELGARRIEIGQGPDADHVVLADPEGNEFCVIEPGNNFLAECGFVGAIASDGTQAVGYFWSAALDWPLVWDQDQETAIRSPHGGPKITWGGPPLQPRHGVNRWHFHLAPTGGRDQQIEVDRLLVLGARLVEAASDADGAVIMADPDGNDFCVLP